MIEIAQASPSVIIVDATYRTNKLNMPAVHFQAITSIGKTASIALAFIINEEEPSYLLACRAFRELIMGDARIEVFLTDDETALKNALKAVYPTVPSFFAFGISTRTSLQKPRRLSSPTLSFQMKLINVMSKRGRTLCKGGRDFATHVQSKSLSNYTPLSTPTTTISTLFGNTLIPRSIPSVKSLRSHGQGRSITSAIPLLQQVRQAIQRLRSSSSIASMTSLKLRTVGC